MLRSFKDKLLRPTDIAILAYLRIGFGLMLLIELTNHYFINELGEIIDRKMQFSYYGFEWLQHNTLIGVHLHHALIILGALGVMLGIFYRFSSILLFLSYVSFSLIERTTYINHTYLYSLLCFLIIFLPANCAVSFDVWRNPRLKRGTIPFWMIGVFIFEISIVYFYAGVAKLNTDWLQAIPMKFWMPNKEEQCALGWITNFLGFSIMSKEWFGWLLSYAGCLFDLSIAFIMLNKKTRKLGLCVAVCFHFTNVLIFGLASFPWFSMLMTTIYFPPHFPRKLRALKKFFTSNRLIDNFNNESKFHASRTMYLFIAFGVFQLIFPLRQFLYKNNSWSERGHMYSWHMMLRGKDGSLLFKVIDKFGKVKYVRPSKHLTKHQYRVCRGQPDLILQFAHYIRDELYDDTVKVYAVSSLSLNKRKKFQEIVPKDLDLSKESRCFEDYTWIVPLRE